VQIIPAIDIRAGKCVRLLQGQAEQQTIYSDDPVAMARRWATAGAPLLHVVDLDGAFTGQLQNFAVMQHIVHTVPVPVQVGGGVRDLETIQTLLDAGVSRVVLGTAVLEQWDLFVTATARFPGRICVGIDCRDGRVAVRGWQTISEVEPLALIRQVATTRVAAIIYTDITRDGTLQGPNLAGIAALAQAVAVPIIASGGVSQIEDLQRLARLGPPGVAGVIVGKALYEGRFDYQQACAALRSEHSCLPNVLSRA
jgi:phosphoribosylformimino-5-aminoimidazole carboxamide ribotide isomerase